MKVSIRQLKALIKESVAQVILEAELKPADQKLLADFKKFIKGDKELAPLESKILFNFTGLLHRIDVDPANMTKTVSHGLDYSTGDVHGFGRDGHLLEGGSYMKVSIRQLKALIKESVAQVILESELKPRDQELLRIFTSAIERDSRLKPVQAKLLDGLKKLLQDRDRTEEIAWEKEQSKDPSFEDNMHGRGFYLGNGNYTHS